MALGLTASAQTSGKQVLHGHLPKELARLKPVGALSGETNLQLAISLPLRNTAALSILLNQIYSPGSPKYHHYLTPRQFTAQFGPTARDYLAVIKFARANGLRVTAQYPNRLVLDVSGPVANIERAFHTTLHTYQHPTENRLFYAPDTEPSVDLNVPILHIDGLDNYSLPRPRLQTVRPAFSQKASPNSGAGPGGSYMGSDFRAAYVPDTTLTGSDQAVGLLEFDGYTSSDITYYEGVTGLPNVPLQNVLIDGATGAPSGSGGEVEVSLDIEVAISMAPGLSKVIVYEATGSFVDVFNRMATDNQAKQLSCSWYIPGGTEEPAADQIFEEMAAQGQSFFNASGDHDAYTGLIDFPGDTPFITQVGGTTLTTSGPGGSWVSETVWNWGNGTGSGGGISTQYPIPTYQTNISMAANQGSTTNRNTPDVALTADNVYVRVDGGDTVVGGTSCAAPLWAGFSALVNQEAVASGHSTIGFVNPLVDAIGSGQNYGTAFHDIITGNNEWSGSPNKFLAVAGYDLCTGWGTPAGQHLIDALANPEALIITPASGFTAIGGVGGPFSVTSENLSLTNSGTNILTWSLVNTSAWLNASISGGTLSPHGPATIVTFSLNNTASNLPVGNYSATVWFTNLDDNFGQSRQFALNVISPPGITSQPTNQAVLDGATAMFSAGVTGGLPLSYQWQFNGTNLTEGGNISGSSTTTLIISNASTNNVGAYDLVATNYAGVAVSSNAFLSLIPSPPVITQQPTNETVGVNTTVRFSVAAVGTKPFSYQWSFNTTNIEGASSATLVLPNVQFSQAGEYAVTVSNIYGAITSSNALLTVLPCDPDPAGLVAWWRAEDNTYDSIGANNGTITGGITYTNGEVGQAFFFDGTSGYISIPASSSLDVGAGDGLTIECWIWPNHLGPDGANGRPIVEWDDPNTVGTMLWFENQYTLVGNLRDPSGVDHTMQSAPGTINTNEWQHVAETYDKASGNAYLYINGVQVVSTNFGSITPNTSLPLYLGIRAANGYPGSGSLFNGGLDEVSIYSRALSAEEISEIYNIGSVGKCFNPVPPSITTEPTNQTAFAGSTAIFSVAAAGTQPLYYQWIFNGTNIIGATNATLILNNVQFNQAGDYAVSITNVAGSTNSTMVTLTVNPPPPCDPAPTGMVAWWRAESNTDDSIGGNNGMITGGVTYTNGEVGQAYSFDGTTGYISVPASPSLDVGSGNGLTIECWIWPNHLGPTGANGRPIVEWDDANTVGTMLWFENQYTLVGNLRDPSGVDHTMQSAPGTINTNQWQHVAETYDKASGNAYLYINGVQVVSTNFGTITPNTSLPLFLGIRAANGYPGSGSLYNGSMDEVSIYDRALSASEISGIYAAGPGGKCPVPPSIITEPANQAVFVGSAAIFSVDAVGTQPLYYQWNYNGTNIVGATNAMLVLNDVQFSQAGDYTVSITNLYGSTNSTAATLTVNPVPPCDPAPSGMVAWWRAETNTDDSIGGNNGTINGGVTYTNGEVGQAFSFDGTTGYISVPASPSLDVGSGNGLTIECWIWPNHLGPAGAAGRPIVEWDDPNTVGTMLWFENQYTLVGNLRDPSGVDHAMQSTPGTVNTNGWQHVAETYDKTSGNAYLYINGVQVVSTNFGSITPNTSLPLYLGIRAANGYPGSGSLYNGGLDEVSIYGRALSADEINAIYAAGPAGKCFTAQPPSIIAEPTNQTVFVGGTATFSVTATGTQPLYYQWNFNGTNVVGATNATLTLNDVQFSQAGNYAVSITNVAGSTNSTAATLTVNPAQPCDPAPSGMVAWWRAEGNVNDSVGTNNGAITGGVTYANGEVGQSFFFDGTSGYISIPASPSLDVGSGSNGLTIECWIWPNHLGPAGAQGRPIVEYDSSSTIGTTLWFENQYTLVGDLRDPSGVDHVMQSAPGTVNTNGWQHVAETYDKASGNAYLYLNGVQVVSTNFGSITPNTSLPLYLGIRAANGYPGSGSLYNGGLDEVSIYARALSADEINAIYAAGPAGKCFTAQPPSIIAEPTNQSVFVGGTATFSVTATGTQPLYYQWNFNGTNIVDATNAMLVLNDVQLSQVGNYAVSITNIAGSTNSIAATLTVNPPQLCDPPPSGLVGWWRAQGDVTDSVWTNNGSITGGVTYTNGEVGQAFSFDGTSGYISIPASSNLNVGTGSGLTIECWIWPNHLGPAGAQGRPIVEFDSSSTIGTTLWFENQYTLVGDLRDPSGVDHVMQSAPGSVNTNGWQHVAETYDKASGNAYLYINGVQVVSANFGTITPNTSLPLYLGIRAANGYPGSGSLYNGGLDEVSIYSRALSQSEIQAIYNAGSGGKCLLAPSIVTQPASQTVFAGTNATFSVTVIGASPRAYQWWNGSGSIPGATNSTLTLSNVQSSQAGIYYAVVSNSAGAVTSSNAVLTVIPHYYFAWNPIPSPRFVSNPFAVTIQAMLTNGVYTNFSGTVALTSTNGLPVKPTISGNFNNGMWNGSIMIAQPVSNLVLQAADAIGQPGMANPIDITARPSLTTGVSGNTFYMTWPVNPSGFVLETASDLNGPWAPVGGSPVQIGGEYLEQLQLNGTNSFYRLRFTGP